MKTSPERVSPLFHDTQHSQVGSPPGGVSGLPEDIPAGAPLPRGFPARSDQAGLWPSSLLPGSGHKGRVSGSSPVLLSHNLHFGLVSPETDKAKAKAKKRANTIETKPELAESASCSVL